MKYEHSEAIERKKRNGLSADQELQHTRFASSLSWRHSPKAFTKVIKFFFGSGLARASIIGLRGLEKKRIICRKRQITELKIA